jgi:hypothetical protein
MRWSPKTNGHPDGHLAKCLSRKAKTGEVTIGDHSFFLYFLKTSKERERKRKRENKKRTVEVIGEIGKTASFRHRRSPSLASAVMPRVHSMGGRP